ncbi:MAG: DUF5678 domain-containing protein [Dissulfurispiraceae bacterium]
MADNVMVRDVEKYSGLFVATLSFTSKDVISSGKDAMSVLEDAKKKGADDPVVFYIPERDMVHIY